MSKYLKQKICESLPFNVISLQAYLYTANKDDPLTKLQEFLPHQDKSNTKINQQSLFFLPSWSSAAAELSHFLQVPIGFGERQCPEIKYFTVDSSCWVNKYF